MPFGLVNAPATFSRLMDKVLEGLTYHICLVYLDDILIYSQDFSQNLERLQAVFDQLHRADLKVKPNKCEFKKKSCTFLGHIVDAQGIYPAHKKIEAVKSWPRPDSVKQVQSFLGLANFYRRFVPRFADISQPLTALTRKNVKFVWSEDCEKAFSTLKEKLTKPPVLVHPSSDLKRPMQLSIDASGFAIGSILSQEVDGHQRPIAYASKTLSTSEIGARVTGNYSLSGFLPTFPEFSTGSAFCSEN